MSLIGCVGHRISEAVASSIEEAIKDDAPERLDTLLLRHVVSNEGINRKHFLHQAAWLGYPVCVKVLLNHGANPNWPHRKNGCPALHLAHFRTIEETNPSKTIQELVSAGAIVNSRGSVKCGKMALDHAIQYKRFDSVMSLIQAKTVIKLQSVVTAIDVADPQILELLLLSGGKCGRRLEATLFWGHALHRVIYTPLKYPKECYKSMFKLLTEATVCLPIMYFLPSDENCSVSECCEKECPKMSVKTHLMIETELRNIAKDYVDLAQYLYVFMIRNGYRPNDSVKLYMSTLGEIDWIESYLSTPQLLKDLSARVVRTDLNRSGNILYGIKQANLPSRIKDILLFRGPVYLNDEPSTDSDKE